MIQETGVPVYTAEFRCHASILGWDDAALHFQYYRGLKSSIKNTMANKPIPPKLKDLITEAELIGNRHHVCGLEKRASAETLHSKPKDSSRPSHICNSNPSSSSSQTRKPFVKRGKLSAQEKAQRYHNGLCVYCEETGHQVDNCPNKPAGKPLCASEATFTIANKNPKGVAQRQ
ncbi:hypothetical protein T439DRAFT_295160 [Meredithblackwellia eburnea MCA 4105]